VTISTRIPDLTHLELHAAVQVPALEHRALPEILDIAMPGVQHRRREIVPIGGENVPADEHMLFDPSSDSAARIVITWSRWRGESTFAVASIGSRPLFEQLVVFSVEWNAHGRAIPPHWRSRR
jgi:hypothetical protein